MPAPGSSPVPEALAAWTFASVQALCAVGYCESDRHDFKHGLPDSKGLTKVACAFANTFGGFVVLGVKEGAGQFDPIGIEPNSEIFGQFHGKVRAEPDIAISYPKQIEVPSSSKVIYIFEILQSTRRPHLPSPVDERTFWKRVGSDCRQMTLEEVRHQMLTLEEKREKLALLLIDLFHKQRSLEEQANLPDGHYTGEIFSFDIIDRVVVESYSILKDDINTIGVLDTMRKSLLLLNFEKQQLLSILSMGYDREFKIENINKYRGIVKNQRPLIVSVVAQIEQSLGDKYGIVNPYHQQ